MSPMAPAGRAKRKYGRVEAVWVSATYSGLAPIDTMSHAAPTLCMNVPRSDTTSARSSRRKIGVRSGRHSLAASFVGDVASGIEHVRGRGGRGGVAGAIAPACPCSNQDRGISPYTVILLPSKRVKV